MKAQEGLVDAKGRLAGAVELASTQSSMTEVVTKMLHAVDELKSELHGENMLLKERCADLERLLVCSTILTSRVAPWRMWSYCC